MSSTALPPDRTDVLFVRHADVHNPENVFYARLPRFKLSEQGLKDAEVTAQALAEEPVAAIYTSPMLRAKQTARVIARQHPRAPLIESRLLIEIRTHFQGQGWAGIPRHPNFYDPRAGDETVHQVFQRMNRLLLRLVEQYRGSAVVCVSHGDPIKILRMGYLGRPLTRDSAREPDPAKGSITRFTWHECEREPEISYFEPHTGRRLVGYWEQVGRLSDLPESGLRAATVEGAAVVLIRAGDEVHVMSGHCGHMRTLLWQGRLEGSTLTCPLHESRYDVRTGKVLREAQVETPLCSRLNGEPLEAVATEPRQTYDVRIDGDAIFARIR